MTLHRAIVQGLDDSENPIGVTTAVDFRQALGILAQRDGVFYEADDSAELTGSGSSMEVTIGVFRAAYESALGGHYLITEDGDGSDDTLELAASDTSNDRIDVLYVWQKDVQIDDTQLLSPVAYGIETGTPAGSPVAPTVPTGAFALWEILVPANATTMTDVGVVFTPAFDWTAPVGAPLPVRTQADLPAAGIPGRRAFVLNIPGAQFEDNGSGWVMDGVARFADSSARTAAITSPVAGMRSRLATTAYDEVYRSSSWLPEDVLAAGTLTTASSLNIDGLTGFREYEIVLDLPTASEANAITAQLRASASADSSSNYDYMSIYGETTTAAGSEALAGTSWPLSNSKTDKSIRIRLSSLNASQRTLIAVDAYAANATSAQTNFVAKGRHRSASAFDGIGFTVTSGTVTGTYTVRGIA